MRQHFLAACIIGIALTLSSLTGLAQDDQTTSNYTIINSSDLHLPPHNTVLKCWKKVTNKTSDPTYVFSVSSDGLETDKDVADDVGGSFIPRECSNIIKGLITVCLNCSERAVDIQNLLDDPKDQFRTNEDIDNFVASCRKKVLAEKKKINTTITSQKKQ